MFKIQKTLKRLLTLSLAVLAVSACQSKAPKMDPVDVYVHEVSTKTAYCSNSQTGKCPALPIEKTNGFTMFSPKGTETILNYIDTLKCMLDGGCGAETKYVGNVEMIRVHKENGTVTKWTRVQDVQEAHRQLKSTFKNLNYQFRAAKPE